MLALTGTYYNGNVILEEKIKSEKPLKMIVTFIEDDILHYIEDKRKKGGIKSIRLFIS